MKILVVRPAELAAALRCSERSLRRMWERGDIPEPTRLGPRRLVWPIAEVNEWLAERGFGELEPAEPAETTQEVIQ